MVANKKFTTNLVSQYQFYNKKILNQCKINKLMI